MVTQILPSSTLPVFSNFHTCFRKPAEITVQSRDGNTTMLDDLPDHGLAIVGTRSPQRRSVEILNQTLQDLKHTSLIIVSGFARGVDAHAHEMAIRNGLRTIAILGAGIEVNYPKENARLRKEILESGGLIISQFEKDAPPAGWHFHERNGMIAGFAKATWVVEAAEVSGTLNTANWANQLGRDLYATPCFPNDPFYQGNVKLLSQRQTEKYPPALSFFSAASLGSTWSELGTPKFTQSALKFPPVPKSDIQRWVLELESIAGECKIQNLMTHASKQGYTLGKFYHLFEAEVEAGVLKHEASGRVLFS